MPDDMESLSATRTADVRLAEQLVRVIKDLARRSERAPSVPRQCPAPSSLSASMPARSACGASSLAAEFVLALITPNSLRSPWVLFELGAAWAGWTPDDPAAAGRSSRRPVSPRCRSLCAIPVSGEPRPQLGLLHRLVDQLAVLRWARAPGEEVDSAIEDLVALAKEQRFAPTLLDEIGSSFMAKSAAIGDTQRQYPGQLADQLPCWRGTGTPGPA